MYMHRKIGLWVWNIVQSSTCRELDQGYLLASELLGAEAAWLVSRPTDPVTAAGTSWCSVDEAHVPSGREAGMTRHLSRASAALRLGERAGIPRTGRFLTKATWGAIPNLNMRMLFFKM